MLTLADPAVDDSPALWYDEDTATLEMGDCRLRG